MVDIRVTGLVKSFDLEKKILNGLSFQVDSGERVGLLGKNGAGKTTLFRMLTGELEPDEGESAAGRRPPGGSYLPDPGVPGGVHGGGWLRSAFARMYRMKDEMDTLALRMEQGRVRRDHPPPLRRAERPVRGTGRLGHGHGGEQGGGRPQHPAGYAPAGLRLSVRRRKDPGELRPPDFGGHGHPAAGRADEPFGSAGHRVAGGILRKFRGTVVTISHDRYFLDRTVTRIIEIQDGKAEFYSGNYSFYAIEKERRYQERMKQYLKEQAKIQQLEKAAEQMHLWAFMGNDALHKRAFSMEKRIERMRTTQKPTKARKLEARFQSREFKGDEVLADQGPCQELRREAAVQRRVPPLRGRRTHRPAGRERHGQDHAAEHPHRFREARQRQRPSRPSVKAAYLPQVIHFDHPERSILDTMLYELDITPQSARNRLAAYQFTGEDVFKKVSVLSGGELSRLRLCMLMDESINLLILDEPTNHLDIDSREWLEEAVEAFDGTLLFVSHDRYFINRFATRVWELENGTVSDYPMGFAQYRQAKEEEHAAASPQLPVPPPPKKTGSRGNAPSRRQRSSSPSAKRPSPSWRGS